MEGEGFEPPNPKERIYSPPRLASSLSFQKGRSPGTLYGFNVYPWRWPLSRSTRTKGNDDLTFYSEAAWK